MSQVMEWSKDKTLKLIELLQRNPTLWNASHCDARRDKQLQKRKEELRYIGKNLGVYIPDINKKIQHLRTQYNREAAREARVNAEDPNDRYVSNWYAYEYMHFIKDPNKPYKIIPPVRVDHSELNDSPHTLLNNFNGDCKLQNTSPSHKRPRTELAHSVQPDIPSPTPQTNRDEFSVFGEYVANELRSLKGEKNLLVAKKKIQDVIFEVKMGMICDCEPKSENSGAVYTNTTAAVQSGKIFTAPMTADQIEPLTTATSGVSEIIINGGWHYSNAKVCSQ